jgi:ABC-2 type transport system permease protein
MKGLLVKDFYTLIKQLRLFLLIIVLFSLMQGSSTSSFAFVYSAMLPITSLAYDERSKWDKLAAMMPYSKRSIVLEKYLLGYICLAAVAILTFSVKIAISLSSGKPVTVEIFTETLPAICAASLFLAINLPFMFKLGVEKGRLVFIALVIIIVIGGVAFADKISQWVSFLQVDFTLFVAVIILLAVAINALSIALSISIYKKKDN